MEYKDIYRYKYKYIVFDLDGTIIDSRSGIIHSLKHTLSVLNLGTIDEKDLNAFLGPPLKASFMEIVGLDDRNADYAVKVFREDYTEYGLLDFSIYPNIIEFISYLYDCDIKIGIATSKPIHFAERILETLNIRQYISGITGSIDNADHSSKDKLLRACLMQMNCRNYNDALMVGDRRFDIQAANNLGIDSVGVLYGYGDFDELFNCQPTYIIKNIMELKQYIFN